MKYPTVYATSKFDVGEISSPLHLPLKLDAIFKKQRASKVPIHLHDKVNRLLDILEQYENISPVKKKEQPKGNKKNCSVDCSVHLRTDWSNANQKLLCKLYSALENQPHADQKLL